MKIALISGILFAGLGAYLQDEDQAKRIAQFVEQLSSDDFEVREKASSELKKIGSDAIPALQEAAKSEDPETRMRAESLLESLKKKPTPTPRRKSKTGPGVSIQSRNGDSVYTVTPSKGDPITFHKRRDGSVLLEYIDLEGKEARAEADSLNAFLEDHPELAKRFGISQEGIKYGGARASFRNQFQFKFSTPEDFGQDFGGLEEELRKRMEGLRKLFEEPGEFSMPDDGNFFRFGSPRQKAVHGAVLVAVPAALRAHVSIPKKTGVMVNSVKSDTLAWRFGLKKYDVILKIGDTPVRSAADVKDVLDEDGSITLLRKGKEVLRHVEY